MVFWIIYAIGAIVSILFSLYEMTSKQDIKLGDLPTLFAYGFFSWVYVIAYLIIKLFFNPDKINVVLFKQRKKE